jgi:hypothetical protein
MRLNGYMLDASIAEDLDISNHGFLSRKAQKNT